jgi:predicted dehydrogenase
MERLDPFLRPHRQTGPTLRAALIGCGSVGSYFMDELAGHSGRQALPIGHAEVLRTHPRTDLVAGADPDPDRLAAFGGRWEVDELYLDHREMLERVRPEFVSIASPPDLHPGHVLDCVDAGVRIILCEKPVAPTLREADAMIDACDRAGVVLGVNHTLRGDPYYLQARRLITEGAIGDVLTISTSWAGRLFLTGTHHFDLVNFLLGDGPTDWLVGHAERPEDRHGAVATQRGIDLGGTSYVVFGNGSRAFLNGRDGTAWRRTEVIGRDGAIVIDNQDAQLWRVDPSSRFRDPLRHPFPQLMHHTSAMLRFVDDLIAAQASAATPLSSGRTARHALAQVLATHASSMDDNRKVIFPFDDLDARAPYRWFTGDAAAAYDAGERDAEPDRTDRTKEAAR